VLDYLKSSSEREPADAPESTPELRSKGAIPPAAGGRERRQRMSTIRVRIAERLVAAQHAAAMLTTFNEADLLAVHELRKRYKEPFQARHGVTLGLMSFFVKASVEALRAYPIVNAWIDGSDIVFHDYYNLGVAVSTDKGLMVPVLRDADRMNFAEIEKRLADLAEKARAGKIAVDDLQGGTFTITNGGVFGSLMSTPILNPPQSAILGMHAIQQRPVVRQDQIVIRPMMYLALSYDHRLIDGRDAVRFLIRIKECIENPERMLLEV
jgi:2-oxoglutarate dehydrogenase E2 component (dihydrolipoamide succinyltransferase)